MNVPDATISSHSRSYSFWLPSTQWIAAGCVSSAIFSTHRIRCLLVVSGLAMLNFPCFIVLLPLLQPLAALCINQLDQQYSLTANLPLLLPFADRIGRSRKTRKSSSSLKIRRNRQGNSSS